MPQQANSYGWIPLARAAAVKGSLAGWAYRRASTAVAVADLVAVVVAEYCAWMHYAAVNVLLFAGM